MNKNYLPYIISFSIFFLSFTTNGFGQYMETFSTPNKGVLAGTCSGTEASCTIDYTGVDWTINGDFSGMDSNDFFSTDGSGRLNGDGDNDASAPGLCFETPVLDISGASGSVSFTIDLDWVSWDFTDIGNVEYQINGGAWVKLPPLPGTDGPGTLDFSSDGNTGSGVATASGLSGNTLSIRVCLITNSSFDDLFIDNVSVPEAGVTILPVELFSFSAIQFEEMVKLDWSTLTETNNEKFEIEHSNSGRNFNKIGEIEGEGASVEIALYSFDHKLPSIGQNYYRLKQVDFDGRFEYSEVMTVFVVGKQGNLVTIYPNPVSNGEVYLNYYALNNSILEISIYNITGIYTFGQKVPVKKGENNLLFEISDLKKGIYLIKFGNNNLDDIWKKIIIE